MLSQTISIPVNCVACLYSADEEMKLMAAWSAVPTGDHVAGMLIFHSPPA
uniref:Uncharacterized protein n=1 Tax=Setaria italica TaxID=4555 RepID=K3ZZ20_SETIT